MSATRSSRRPTICSCRGWWSCCSASGLFLTLRLSRRAGPAVRRRARGRSSAQDDAGSDGRALAVSGVHDRAGRDDRHRQHRRRGRRHRLRRARARCSGSGATGSSRRRVKFSEAVLGVTFRDVARRAHAHRSDVLPARRPEVAGPRVDLRARRRRRGADDDAVHADQFDRARVEHARSACRHGSPACAVAVLTWLVIIGGIKSIGRAAEKLTPLKVGLYLAGGLFVIVSLRLAHSRGARAGLPRGVLDAGRRRRQPRLPRRDAVRSRARDVCERGRLRHGRGGLRHGTEPAAGAAGTERGDGGVHRLVRDLDDLGDDDPADRRLAVGHRRARPPWRWRSTRRFPAPAAIWSRSAVFLFGYTTLIGWAFYGEQFLEYIFGPRVVTPYRWIYCLLIPFGAITKVELVWAWGDLMNALQVFPNIIGVLGLSGLVAQGRTRALDEADAAVPCSRRISRSPTAGRCGSTRGSRFPMASIAPSPNAQPVAPNSHLRWHPLRGEWIAYASHRQHRTFLPPPEWNPLAVTTDPAAPTEVPAGAVGGRGLREPVSDADAGSRTIRPRPSSTRGRAAAPARSSCSRRTRPRRSDVCRSIASRSSSTSGPIATKRSAHATTCTYVFPFENRGVEVGVTLHHPHGQIYAYPFVPPVAARELRAAAGVLRCARARAARGLAARVKLADAARRVIYRGEHVLAFVPVCARYPYEVWVAPHAARAIACRT